MPFQSRFDIFVQEDNAMILTGFMRLGVSNAGLLIPLFRSKNSDESFVQAVDGNERIAGFCPADLESLDHEDHVVFRGDLVRCVGDEALLAFLLPGKKRPIVGTLSELRVIFGSLDVSRIPAFLRYELASLSGNKKMITDAIDIASRAFSSAENGSSFMLAEFAIRLISEPSSATMHPLREVEPVGCAAEPQAQEARGDWSAPLDPRFTFDTFVVGKPNEFAHACARRVAEKPAMPGFNPLFLYGGVGLGKTHLMHAIAWAIREQHPTRQVAYMSAEKFMYRFIAALRSQSTMEFKESLRSVDVLLIDDLQFLIGKDHTQEEFFHTFNALVDAGKQIIVSSDKPPAVLAGIEDRLRTQLGQGIVADLHATTYELRISILQAKVRQVGVAVPPKVLEFLAHKIVSNVRELEGALNRLIAHANLFGRPVTLEGAQEALHDVLRAHVRRVTTEEIQKKVAEHHNIGVSDVSSPAQRHGRADRRTGPRHR
jgi:chromosomal replication initiator protein DnaA